VVAWFWNPPYGFSPEDNLAYRDYIILHEDGERFLEARYPMARVLTAWPASDEITRPWLGYTTRPMRVVRIEDFSLDEILSAADLRSNYDVALIFSTKYEPAPALWDHWRAFTEKRTELKTRFFGFHRDLPPAAAAQILGGHVVFSEQRQGQWIAVIEMVRVTGRVEEARKRLPSSFSNQVHAGSRQGTFIRALNPVEEWDVCVAQQTPHARAIGNTQRTESTDGGNGKMADIAG
jgi:hypothetical protein